MAWDKVEMRMEMAARLELTGLLPDVDIAQHIGLTPAGYAQMKTRVEYIQIRNRIKFGVLTDMDEKMGDLTDILRQKVKDNLPVALNTIITLAANRDAVGLKAAQSLIEIDGRLAPVKRTAVAVTDEREVSKSDNDMAAALLAALDKRAKEEKQLNGADEDGVTIQ